MSQEVHAPNSKAKKRNALVILVIVVIVVISVWAYYRPRSGPLSEVEGGIEYKIDSLPRGFYKTWDYVSVSVYSGEPHLEGRYIIYPIWVGWSLNSSSVCGGGPIIYDFGARNISGAWFNLTLYDFGGDWNVSDGDYITVTSFNGSLAPNTDYLLQFTTRSMLNSGIAPFYTVLGFRYSALGFDSWVETEPNEFAM
jgi:hypothetical protein